MIAAGPWTEYTLAGIETALAHGGETHTVGDVCNQILAGDAQLWEDEGALIITEIHHYPRKKICHYWLATGELDAVVRLSHKINEWAKEVGCESATLAGRKGWERVLASEGWTPMLTVMGREL